jgi:hypothetical protein
MNRFAVAAVAAGVLVWAGEARAESEAPERPFESSAGLKLFAGGNLWTKPSNVPPGYEGIGFAGDGGGFGFGAALYYEARLFRHLGLEVDLGYDRSILQRSVTYNRLLELTEKVTSSGPRISLLAKGILPAPFGRLWAGLGPEFLLPSSAEASLEITKGKELIPNSEAERLASLIGVEKQSSTMLTFAFGAVVHAGPLEIPFDLRAAKNLSQDSDWTDRVSIDAASEKYVVTAQSSWDFRLGLGVGYRF